MPCSAMAASVGPSAARSVTPLSELVVAPRGYSLHANTMPLALASAMSASMPDTCVVYVARRISGRALAWERQSARTSHQDLSGFESLVRT